MKLKKLFSLFAGLLAVSILLCACKDEKGSDSNDEDVEKETEQVTLPPTESLTYKLNEGGLSYCVTGNTDYMAKNIVIPSTYNGKPVTVIESSAFSTYYSDGWYENFFIPDSITKIGSNAFGNQTKIMTVEGDVSYVEKWIVDCDPNVASITLRSGIVGIACFGFSDCKSITTVEIPKGVKYINDYAFSNCKLLETIILPKSIENIGTSAFSKCGSLKTITYQGTKAEWDMISKGDWWQGLKELWESQYTFTVKCTDGDIIIER